MTNLTVSMMMMMMIVMMLMVIIKIGRKKWRDDDDKTVNVILVRGISHLKICSMLRRLVSCKVECDQDVLNIFFSVCVT